MTSKNRLLTLDGMRGLAAILVVIYHFEAVVKLVPSGYLAVDFFFLLSGLVIARTYAPRFEGGLKTKDFVVHRIIRLYPLFFIGLLVGLVRAMGQTVLHLPDGMGFEQVSIAAVFGFFMLPAPFEGRGLFPVNGPAWSLFLELVANLIYAVLIVRLPKKALAGLIVLFLVGLVGVVVSLGKIQGGQDWSSIGFGFSRVMFSFTVGVFLAKSGVGDKTQNSWWCVVPAALLCASLIYEPSAGTRGVYDLLMVVLAYPLIVSVGARLNPPAVLANPMNVLGEISYPIYIIHYAPLFMASFIARKLALPVAIWVPAFIVGLCGVSYFLAKYYDPAARRVLASLLPSFVNPMARPRFRNTTQ